MVRALAIAALSLLVHAGGAWILVALVESESERESPPVPAVVANVDPVYLPPEPTRRRPRLGDGRPADHRALESLRTTRTAGADAAAVARPHEALLVGEDLDLIRFRPYDHRRRNAVARQTRSTGVPRRRRSRGSRGAQGAGDGSSAAASLVPERVGEEPLSKLPKDGAIAAARTPGARHSAGARQRSEGRPASNARRIHAVDMAATSGRGKAAGRGRGAAAGRRGAPGGERSGLPIWLNTADLRYVGYFRGIYKRIQPLWSFPKDLAVQLEQGDVLVQFTILESGEVARISVRKPSGFPRFDRAATDAVRRAAPFPRIPPGLGKRLEILAPFEFHNPMVR